MNILFQLDCGMRSGNRLPEFGDPLLRSHGSTDGGNGDMWDRMSLGFINHEAIHRMVPGRFLSNPNRAIEKTNDVGSVLGKGGKSELKCTTIKNMCILLFNLPLG